MKDFNEYLCDRAAKMFTFLDDPRFVNFVSRGAPIAIAATLQDYMSKSGASDVEFPIESKDGVLMTFGLKCNRKGDAVSFLPSFELGSAGEDILKMDASEKSKNIIPESVICDIANKLMDNTELVENLTPAFKSSTYVNGKWEENTEYFVKASVTDDENEATKSEPIYGLNIQDAPDLVTLFAVEIAVILELLTIAKSPTDVVKVDIVNLGEFTITPEKNKYNLSLTFSKAFKSACKNDKLAEKIGSSAE